MPHIERWSGLPAAIRDHLVERMHDRNISLNDLNLLRLWMESRPEVPQGAVVQGLRLVQTLRRGPVSENLSSASSSREGTKALANSTPRAGPAVL
jgi:hypothetical protein